MSSVYYVLGSKGQVLNGYGEEYRSGAIFSLEAAKKRASTGRQILGYPACHLSPEMKLWKVQVHLEYSWGSTDHKEYFVRGISALAVCDEFKARVLIWHSDTIWAEEAQFAPIDAREDFAGVYLDGSRKKIEVRLYEPPIFKDIADCYI